MFRFADPEYLYLLLLIPFLIGIYLLTALRNKRRLSKFGDPRLLIALVPAYSRRKPGKVCFTFVGFDYIDRTLSPAAKWSNYNQRKQKRNRSSCDAGRFQLNAGAGRQPQSPGACEAARLYAY